MIHHQKHRRMDFVHMMTEYIQTKYTIREKIIENNQNKILLFRVDDQFDPHDIPNRCNEKRIFAILLSIEKRNCQLN